MDKFGSHGRVIGTEMIQKFEDELFSFFVFFVVFVVHFQVFIIKFPSSNSFTKPTPPCSLNAPHGYRMTSTMRESFTCAHLDEYFEAAERCLCPHPIDIHF